MVNKIIFLITYYPPYEQYGNDSRPAFHWNKQDGSWVGVWGYDFGDLIGKALVSNYPQVEFEVWQVDKRADKQYTAQLAERLVHRQFPAKDKKYRRGIKISGFPYSKAMEECILKNDDEQVIIFIPSGINTPFGQRLIGGVSKAKIVYYNFLNTELLLPHMTLSKDPFRLLHRYLLKRMQLSSLKMIRNLMTYKDNPEAIEQVKRLNPLIKIFYFKFGVDLDYWKEVISKTEARKILGIPEGEFVMLLSQRLVPEYQTERFIEAVSRVRSQRPLSCFITGHGLREYESYLTGLVDQYNLKDKVNFTGYLSEEKLRQLYIASDAFVTVPKMFAGSNGAVKAIAMERPVIHVNLGNTYIYLLENHAGLFLEPTDYDQWVREFEEVVDGKEIPIVPRHQVVKDFTWKKTAEEVFHVIENAQ